MAGRKIRLIDANGLEKSAYNLLSNASAMNWRVSA
jgi:hypothetical protein